VTVAEENWGFFLSAMPADAPAHQKFLRRGAASGNVKKTLRFIFLNVVFFDSYPDNLRAVVYQERGTRDA
jgi:hypothetical protein